MITGGGDFLIEFIYKLTSFARPRPAIFGSEIDNDSDNKNGNNDSFSQRNANFLKLYSI